MAWYGVWALTVLKLSIGLETHTRPQVVEDERLLRLCDSKLPGKAGSLDGGPHLSRRDATGRTEPLAMGGRRAHVLTD